MKRIITLVAIIALFFVGTYSSIGQDDTKEKDAYNLKKREFSESQKIEMKKAEKKPEVFAKKQTQDLKQLLNLDEKQTARIYEICLAIKKSISEVPAHLDADKRTELLNDLEKIKIDKMKEALTEEQFKKYLNSLHLEK